MESLGPPDHDTHDPDRLNKSRGQREVVAGWTVQHIHGQTLPPRLSTQHHPDSTEGVDKVISRFFESDVSGNGHFVRRRSGWYKLRLLMLECPNQED